MLLEIFGTAKVLKLGADWTGRLYRRLRGIQKERSAEISALAEILKGNPLELAKYYVEPNCQNVNPADREEDKAWDTVPTPIREFLNRWLEPDKIAGTGEQDGGQVLFLLADAGMGKTALMVMLKLTHLTRFWQKSLDFRLLKIGPDTLDRIAEIKDRPSTVLLLDALDEDKAAIDDFSGRARDLLGAVSGFHRVVITCRTQFFPSEEVDENRHRVVISGFECPFLYLSLFDGDQTTTFLKKRYPRHWLPLHPDRRHLRRAEAVVARMHSLKMRPMLISRIDILLDSDPSGDSALTSYDIYERMVDSWLRREKRKQRALTASVDELKAMCQDLAVRLQTTDRLSIAVDDLDTFLMGNAAQIKALDIGGRSLMNREGSGNYRFGHRSIQEFLVARSLLEGEVEPGFALTDQIAAFLAERILSGFGEDGSRSDARIRAFLEGLDQHEGPRSVRGRIFQDYPDVAMTVLERLGGPSKDIDLIVSLDRLASSLAWGEARAEHGAHRLATFRRHHLFNHYPAPSIELFQEIETPRDGRVPLWCEIPAGEFTMGGRGSDEGPLHTVRLAAPFRMAAVPITNAQYRAFDPGFKPHRWKGVSARELDHHPAVDISWEEATVFCLWLSQLFEGARLPTEAEWEYACRAGTTTEYWSGDTEQDLSRVGWYNGNSGNKTHPVGEKAANKWGLYDVHGNVWEWTMTWWTDNYSELADGRTIDPLASPADLAGPPRDGRVVRGGSFRDTAEDARSAIRDGRPPSDRYLNVGFRVLLPGVVSPS